GAVGRSRGWLMNEQEERVGDQSGATGKERGNLEPAIWADRLNHLQEERSEVTQTEAKVRNAHGVQRDAHQEAQADRRTKPTDRGHCVSFEPLCLVVALEVILLAGELVHYPA